MKKVLHNNIDSILSLFYSNYFKKKNFVIIINVYTKNNCPEEYVVNWDDEYDTGELKFDEKEKTFFVISIFSKKKSIRPSVYFLIVHELIHIHFLTGGKEPRKGLERIVWFETINFIYKYIKEFERIMKKPKTTIILDLMDFVSLSLDEYKKTKSVHY